MRPEQRTEKPRHSNGALHEERGTAMARDPAAGAIAVGVSTWADEAAEGQDDATAEHAMREFLRTGREGLKRAAER